MAFGRHQLSLAKEVALRASCQSNKSRRYGFRHVLNSCRTNVFILSIRGKLLHHQRAMSSGGAETPVKYLGAKQINNIITLEIVFVQSVVRIRCGSMRLGFKKKGSTMTKQTSESE